MLLNLEAGLGLRAQAILRGIRLVSPTAPVDILKVFLYKPDYFGNPFCALAQEVMRGRSDWTVGERELLGAYVSTLNHCVY